MWVANTDLSSLFSPGPTELLFRPIPNSYTLLLVSFLQLPENPPPFFSSRLVLNLAAARPPSSQSWGFPVIHLSAKEDIRVRKWRSEGGRWWKRCWRESERKTWRREWESPSRNASLSRRSSWGGPTVAYSPAATSASATVSVKMAATSNYSVSPSLLASISESYAFPNNGAVRTWTWEAKSVAQERRIGV